MKNNYDFALCLSIHLRPVFWLFLHHLSFDCFLKNWANLGLFFIYFHLFKLTSLQFLQQINVKMLFPSSIWYRDSNSRPLEHELFMVFFNTDAQTHYPIRVRAEIFYTPFFLPLSFVRINVKNFMSI